MDLLADLSPRPSSAEAVTHKWTGPLLVLAGA